MRPALCSMALACVVLGTATARAEGPTAKEALAVGKKKAVAWQADAELLTIGGDVDKGGRISKDAPVGWHMSFWSAAAHKQMNINVGGTKQILKAEEVAFHLPLGPIRGDPVDSDMAMSTALSEGLQPGVILNETLAANCPPQTKETACWEVISMVEKKMITYVIGGSGKFVLKK